MAAEQTGDWVSQFMDSAVDLGVSLGSRIVGAIVLWIVGKFVIKALINVFDKGTESRKIDSTVAGYLSSSLQIVLNIILIVLILGVFGVETTTLAGLVAAAGVAIGLAWSGLLSNFAAGIFLVVLRPFKVGDLVEIGGILGVVNDIGLFVTTVNTPDNVRTIVGNNTVFTSTIRNYSANDVRRIDMTAQLAHDADHAQAMALLKEKIAAIPNVLSDPSPDTEILSFNLAGPVLAVRPYCHPDNYWQVYFDTNRVIRDELGEAGFSVPETHHNVAQRDAA